MDSTAEAKQELSQLNTTSLDARKAELAALLRFSDGLRVVENRLIFTIDLNLEVVALRMHRAIVSLYGCNATLRAVAPTRARHAPHWLVHVDRDAEVLARRAGLLDRRGRPVHGIPPHLIAGNVAVNESVWRGAFLARGVLVENGRTTALDVTCPGIEAALALVGIARRLGIRAKAIETRGSHHVVLRNADNIGDLLARMGAPQTQAAWKQRRRHKPHRTDRYPPAGFDDANQRRAEIAAAATAAQVERALAILGDTAPDHLAQAGRLRIEHRLASLEQLAALADPPLSKDTIAGRIRRLIAMAERIGPTANPSRREAI
ncbi:DNA-binding protein WhiA [Mycobacterium intracellulare]|uniref:DNA-binding protein WhiA n=1 Tax=Mycobacterium intracellulare TaxID=1767 RepID=UPI003CC83947